MGCVSRFPLGMDLGRDSVPLHLLLIFNMELVNFGLFGQFLCDLCALKV